MTAQISYSGLTFLTDIIFIFVSLAVRTDCQVSTVDIAPAASDTDILFASYGQVL